MEDVDLLVYYLRRHNLPAYVLDENSIESRDRYIDANDEYHDEPIVLTATWKAVRAFLGY